MRYKDCVTGSLRETNTAATGSLEMKFDSQTCWIAANERLCSSPQGTCGAARTVLNAGNSVMAERSKHPGLVLIRQNAISRPQDILLIA